MNGYITYLTNGYVIIVNSSSWQTLERISLTRPTASQRVGWHMCPTQKREQMRLI
jgi:hypothetical protein